MWALAQPHRSTRGPGGGTEVWGAQLEPGPHLGAAYLGHEALGGDAAHGSKGGAAPRLCV